MGELPLDINIHDPRWDQATFVGRTKHFFTVTNPLNLLLSEDKLHNARTIVENYRAGIMIPGLTENDLWKAKYKYDSAFHPDTGEKLYLIGRMSAQVPMNDYQCLHAHLLQWVNQSFNAVVNFSNRSGDVKVTERQLATAYMSATTGAVLTALGLKSLTQHLPSLVSRFIPFTAVDAANCINIPLMRQREMLVGIPVTDDLGHRLGYSSKAAQLGIFQVVISQICMIMPAMTITSLIVNVLERKDFLKRRPWLLGPMQVGLAGFCLLFSTLLCCALFPQRNSISVNWLEPELRAQIKEQNPNTEAVYFNKGL